MLFDIIKHDTCEIMCTYTYTYLNSSSHAKVTRPIFSISKLDTVYHVRLVVIYDQSFKPLCLRYELDNSSAFALSDLHFKKGTEVL